MPPIARPDRRGPGRGRRAAPTTPSLRLAFALSLAAAALAFAPAARAEAPARPGDPAGTTVLVADLRARILAADSATAALEAWCAERGLAADPRLVAHREAVADKPLTAEQRARLAIGPDEPVRYRRVRLACGDRVVSEADNWYVPARLTPEMNALLDTTRTPFGRVVRPLSPTRRAIAVRPSAGGPSLFTVDALLLTGAGAPFCEVSETYLAGALPGVP